MTAKEFQVKYGSKRSKRRDLNPNEMLAAQLKAEGIEFEREVMFASPRRWRMDFTLRVIVNDNFGRPWRGKRIIAVDLQGGTFARTKLGHSTGAGLQKSFEKLNEASIMGYTVLQFDTQQVRDGIALATIKRALGL